MITLFQTKTPLANGKQTCLQTNNRDLTYSLQQWLLMSISAKNNEQINYASSNIQANYLAIGFIPSLINIINNNIDKVGQKMYQLLLLSTLAQMKNLVRKFWGSKKESINQEDKNILVNSILDLNIKIANIPNHELSYKFRKLIKDIIFFARDKSIHIYPQIVSIIELSDVNNRLSNLPFCLNILLGLSSSSLFHDQKYYFSLTQMVKAVHPHLFGFIKEGERLIHSIYDGFSTIKTAQQGKKLTKKYYQVKRKYEEILYLSIKFMYRAINNECVDNYRQIAVQWSQIAIKKTEVQSFPNQLLNDTADKNEMGSKGNDRFNYYHGKKWALKFLIRMFDRVLLIRKKRTDYNQLTKHFYKQNLDSIVQNFKQTWSLSQPDRIKYSQLKCFQKLICYRPKYFALNYQEEMKYYLTNILPPFMQITQRQLSAIEEDPIQFLSFESNYGFFNTQLVNSRMVAIQLWVNIAKLTEQHSKYEQNGLLRFSFELISNWIQQDNTQNIIFRQIGCFLLCKLKQEYLRIGSIKKTVIQLVKQTIVSNITNCSHYMVLGRAFDLMKTYGEEFDQPFLRQIQNVIYQYYEQFQQLASIHELSPSEEFLLIKACTAFRFIIRNQYLNTQQLKVIIFMSLELISKSGFEDIIHSINSIISKFLNQAQEFAVEIISYIHDWFKKYVELQINLIYSERSSIKYEGVSSGVLKIITTLTELIRGGNHQIIEAIQNQICSIANSFFTNTSEDINFQLRDLSRQPSPPTPTITNHRLKLQNGLYQNRWHHSFRDSILEREKIAAQPHGQILLALRIDYYDWTTPFSWYSTKLYQISPLWIEDGSLKQMLSNILNEKASNTQYVFYMIYRLYNHKETRPSQENNEPKCFALLSLIYYYEHHQSSTCEFTIHESVNALTIKILYHSLTLLPRTPRILKFATQLFSLWIIQTSENIDKYFRSWGNQKLFNFFHNIFVYDSYGLCQMSLTNQKSRCIFGICQVLRIAFTNESLFVMIKPNLNVLIYYAISFTYDLVLRNQLQEGFQAERQSLAHILPDRDEELTAVADNVGTETINSNEQHQQIGDEDYNNLVIYQAQGKYHVHDEIEQYYSMQENQAEQRYFSPLLLDNYELQLLLTLSLIQQTNQPFYENEVRKKYNRKIHQIVQQIDVKEEDFQQHFMDLFLWDDEDDLSD